MKLFFILSVLTVSVYLSTALTITELCQWQTTRNNLIGQLTPAGQTVAYKILAQIQLYTGAAIQPLYEYLGSKYQTFFNSIYHSNPQDHQKLIQLGNLLGYGNFSSGAGPVRDVCQDAKNVDSLVSSISATNRPTVNSLLKEFYDNINYGYKAIIAISQLLDAPLFEQIKKENSTIVNQLISLYGY